MRGEYFGDVGNIKRETTKFLLKCILSERKYFEGDPVPVQE